MTTRALPLAPGRHWRTLAWAVCLATLAHNTEELFTMASFGHGLSDRLGRFDLTPDMVMDGFRLANVTVSVLAITLTAIGTWRRQPLLPGLVAATMVLNAVLPHVPAAVVNGGYAPGVITSVLLILPAGLGYLWYLKRSGTLDGRAIGLLFGGALALIVVALPLSLLLASWLMSR